MVAPVMALMVPPSLVTAAVPVKPANWSLNWGLPALAPRPEVSAVLVISTPVTVPSLATPTMMVRVPLKEPGGATSTT